MALLFKEHFSFQELVNGVRTTDDGKVIVGVAIVGNELNSKDSVRLFKEIKNYLNSSIACITSEEPPPTNSIEFASFCNERFIPV